MRGQRRDKAQPNAMHLPVLSCTRCWSWFWSVFYVLWMLGIQIGPACPTGRFAGWTQSRAYKYPHEHEAIYDPIPRGRKSTNTEGACS